MKCINKMRLLCLCGIAAVFMSGCGQTVVSYDNPYDIYSTSADYGLASEGAGSEKTYFSQNLCVADDVNIGNDTTDSQVAEGAGTFNLATNTVTYAQNIYEKLYPASTTKILTAYIALKYGNLEDYVTVSENAADQASDSSVCGLKAGDVVQLKDLLYGMMLKSGNDAAIAIAEHIGGSVEGFADMMNQEALAMGATRSHFVNPNGLPDENHYTSVYDLYLIFQNAVQDQTFLDIISTMSYDVVYTDVNGAGVEKTWENTNQYLTGKEKAPEGITVVGGKTGTTGAAGYCLVLYSYNASGQPIVSIVLKADGKIVAFTVGEPVSDDTFVVHIEKAFAEVDGAYPMINQQFVQHECTGYQYVNREDDAGSEGLRKAKLSYRPAFLVEKGILTRKNA